MTFKQNWEKTSQIHTLPDGTIERMIGLAYPHQKCISWTLLSGGCGNLNVKIYLSEEKHPLILRIYLRQHNMASREKNIGLLLKGVVPVPLTYFIGECDGYSFAVVEFIPGITLRDFLLTHETYDRALLYEVGMLLSKIASYSFLKPGFFDDTLNVTETFSQEAFVLFIKDSLKNKTVLSQLTSEMILRIEACFEKKISFLPSEKERHLVHGDFDPANILVAQIGSAWHVTGILDWEFAFSGSVLWDVANMLRYAHDVSPIFESSFLQGLREGGIILPDSWQTTVSLLNVSSLPDCLARSVPQNSPKQCSDIYDLIGFYLKRLEEGAPFRKVTIIPYEPQWSDLFKEEAARVKQVLGTNCIDVHHIGSTSIPNLDAKPIIDMIPVVRNIKEVDQSNDKMKALGYEARGEYGIPFRRFFQKGEGIRTHNVHVYEVGNAEIDRHLKFREWMRTHKEDKEAYAALKKDLSEQFPNDMMAYGLGKEAFIRNRDTHAGFKGLRLVMPLTHREWEAYHRIWKEGNCHNFFESKMLTSPSSAHFHFVFYKGSQIVSMAYIELRDKQKQSFTPLLQSQSREDMAMEVLF